MPIFDKNTVGHTILQDGRNNVRINTVLGCCGITNGDDTAYFLFDRKDTNMLDIVLPKEHEHQHEDIFQNHINFVAKPFAFAHPCKGLHSLQSFMVYRMKGERYCAVPMFTDASHLVNGCIKREWPNLREVFFASYLRSAEELPIQRWIRFIRMNNKMTAILELTGKDIEQPENWNPISYATHRSAEILRMEILAMGADYWGWGDSTQGRWHDYSCDIYTVQHMFNRCPILIEHALEMKRNRLL